LLPFDHGCTGTVGSCFIKVRRFAWPFSFRFQAEPIEIARAEKQSGSALQTTICFTGIQMLFSVKSNLAVVSEYGAHAP
jgi:hypothetical protein